MNILNIEIEASKDAYSQLIQTIAADVEDGNISAIQAAAKIKFLSDALKEANDKIKPYVVEELEKYDKRERVTSFGFEVSLREAGTKYDYSNCNHPRYNALKESKAEIEKEQKDIEGFLKGLKSSMAIADESTDGEMVTIYPPVKSSTTSPVFSWSK